MTKEGQTGTKLDVVGRSEDFQRRLALVADHQLHVVTQAAPKNGISQIAPGLICVPDGVALGSVAMPQACQLRKDEPHPVSALASVGQLVNDLAIDLGLGVHKAD